MSKLSEAMQMLAPLAQPENWKDGRWTGQGEVRPVIAEAIDDMRQVDAMMTEIARATSQPATPEERARWAIEMAAAELRALDPGQWPAWILELLDSARGHTPDADYQQVLRTLRDRLSTELG